MFLANHFDYIKEMIGAEHVCMGADYNGFPDVPNGMEAKLLRLLRDYSKAIQGEMDDGFQMKIFDKKNLDAKNCIHGFKIKNHYSND